MKRRRRRGGEQQSKAAGTQTGGKKLIFFLLAAGKEPFMFLYDEESQRGGRGRTRLHYNWGSVRDNDGRINDGPEK